VSETPKIAPELRQAANEYASAYEEPYSNDRNRRMEAALDRIAALTSPPQGRTEPSDLDKHRGIGVHYETWIGDIQMSDHQPLDWCRAQVQKDAQDPEHDPAEPMEIVRVTREVLGLTAPQGHGEVSADFVRKLATAQADYRIDTRNRESWEFDEHGLMAFAAALRPAPSSPEQEGK
jgi:hypothetical protein